MKKEKDIFTIKLCQSIKAGIEFYELKNRITNPSGSFDNAKRFTIAGECECCRSIRKPSRAFPFSHLVHARTAVHVAHSYNMPDSEREIKIVARHIKKQIESGESYEEVKRFLISKSFENQISIVKESKVFKI